MKDALKWFKTELGLFKQDADNNPWHTVKCIIIGILIGVVI